MTLERTPDYEPDYQPIRWVNAEPPAGLTERQAERTNEIFTKWSKHA